MSEVDPAAAVINGDTLNDKTFPTMGANMVERAGLSGRVFYDKNTKQYFQPGPDGDWEGVDRKTFMETVVKFSGFCSTVLEGQKISEVEHVLGYVNVHCRVNYAGPIAGFKRGVIINNGQKILVTHEANPVEPVKGEFPVLYALLMQMFGHGSPDKENEGELQLDYLFGWWRHALDCINGKYKDHRGLCMVFAGEAECGKTLVKDLISKSLGGRECKPYRYMIGKDNFNGEFIGSELWVIDDEQASTKYTDRYEFGANIKSTVADKQYRIRGVHAGGVVLSMYRRLLICLNREPERLEVLPPLNDDVADKISILLAHKHPMPMDTETMEEKEEFGDTLERELPHFIHWLLNEYEMPDECRGRFGVTHFHHKGLCNDLFNVSKNSVIWEQVEQVLDFRDVDWDCFGASELFRRMTDEESSPLTRQERNDLPAANWLGDALSKIAKQLPDRIIHKKVGNSKKYTVCKAGTSIDDALAAARAHEKARQGEHKSGISRAEGDQL